MAPLGRPRILQVSQNDSSGGAQLIALMLHRYYLSRGFGAQLAVGYKTTIDSQTHALLYDLSKEANGISGLSRMIAQLPSKVLQRGIAALHSLRGRENFSFHASRQRFLSLAKDCDVVQSHNLHSNYFDLRCLPQVGSRASLILTLHDAWLLSGHCAHAIGCERWKNGCGKCPDLSIYPALRRDGTAQNWALKTRILRSMKYYVATPSNWLAEQVKASAISDSIVELRVIHNGIDLKVFHPGEQTKARLRLGLPTDANIVLFVADNLIASSYKDVAMLRQTMQNLAGDRSIPNLLGIALGTPTNETNSHSTDSIRYIAYTNDPQRVADYYRAANIYLHPARAETYPTVILEAQACGLPVVATRVGGIPEQIEDGQTGILVDPGDVQGMVRAVRSLLLDVGVSLRMGCAAAEKAVAQYDFATAMKSYGDWIEQIALKRQPNKLIGFS